MNGDAKGPEAIPELDEEVWNRWVQKGRRLERERSQRRRKFLLPVVVVLAILIAAGYQYWPGA